MVAPRRVGAVPQEKATQSKVAQSKVNGPGAAAASQGRDFASLVKKAEEARLADHSEEAERLYKQLVRRKPNFVEGWWYLGTLYYESDQYAEGRDAFRRVSGLKPDMALAWAMLGLCEFETKNYDSALAHLDRADQLKIPAGSEFYDVARYHLALLLIRAGRFELAIRVISDFARQEKDTPQLVEAMGLAGLRKPLLPNELPPLEREMVLDVGRALCDTAARRPANIERDRDILLQKYPNTPEVHFLAGETWLASDSDKAIDEWKKELVISPSHTQALASLAGEYLKRSDYQTALPYADRAVESSTNYFTAHAILGQILTQGDIDVARGVRELEAAVHLAPMQPQVHFALATAYAKAGRKEDAAKERAEFLRLRGENEVAASKPQ